MPGMDRPADRGVAGVVPPSANAQLDELLRRIPKDAGWGQARAEWAKPGGIVAMVTIGGLLLGLLFAGNELYKTNSTQGEILAPLPRLVERLQDRADATDARQKEELQAWQEWRRSVDQGLQIARDNSLDVASLRTRANEADIRITRVVDLFQQMMKEASEKQERATKETNEKLERILIEQAQVKARLEAGRRADPPFDRNRMLIVPRDAGDLRSRIIRRASSQSGSDGKGEGE